MPEKNFVSPGVNAEFGLTVDQEKEFLSQMITVAAKLEDWEDDSRGSGVFINSKQLITVAHVAKRKGKIFSVYSTQDDGKIRKVEMSVKKLRRNLDLAVLELSDSVDGIDYAALETDVNRPFIGESLYMISNPAGITNVATKGHTSYPSSNLPKNLKTKKYQRIRITSDFEHSQTLASAMVPYRSLKQTVTLSNHSNEWIHPRVPMIQADWLQGECGSSGGPVFNAHGRIIGILSFSYGPSDFLIHHRQIREYIDAKEYDDEEVPHEDDFDDDDDGDDDDGDDDDEYDDDDYNY